LFFLSSPVEEVYAVWTSLAAREKAGLISSRSKKIRERNYKHAYSSYIRDFTKLYNTFNKIAQEIDPLVAFNLAFEALNSFSPAAALLDMIAALQSHIQSGKTLSDTEYVREVCTPIIAKCISVEDQDYLKILFEDLGEYMKPEFLPVWRDSPLEPTHFIFSDKGIAFDKKVINQKLFLEMLWLESIRQQLTTGIGLVCPFCDVRDWPEGSCCNKMYRFWLEGIWNYTQGSSQTWQPQGCLKPSPVL
jgi:hypothetical protein